MTDDFYYVARLYQLLTKLYSMGIEYNKHAWYINDAVSELHWRLPDIQKAYNLLKQNRGDE